MSRETLLKLIAGRELNIRVAEDVMGSTYVRDPILGDVESCRLSVSDTKTGPPAGHYYGPLRKYSEEDTAAQQVVEKLSHAYTVRLEFNRDEQRWKCEFQSIEMGLGVGGVSSMSIPEAICKAALLTVMAEEEQGAGLSRNERLKAIVELEHRMFQKVKTTRPALCMDRPESFRIMREMTHSVLSHETLGSYLADLRKAETEGINLLAEKYARMDNRVRSLKPRPVIDEIVRKEMQWMNELRKEHPWIFENEAEGAEKYLSCELETYSERTLTLFAEHVKQAAKQGRNLARERYRYMFQQLGYDSIVAAKRNMEGKLKE